MTTSTIIVAILVTNAVILPSSAGNACSPACNQDQWCNGDLNPGQCAQPRKVGEACSLNLGDGGKVASCEEPLTCFSGASGYKCVSYSQMGEPCSSSQPCLTSYGLWCNLNLAEGSRVCIGVRTLGLGKICRNYAFCQSQFYCDGSPTKTCVAKKAPPGSCSSGDSECTNVGMGGNWCPDLVPRNCTARKGLDEACNKDIECKWYSPNEDPNIKATPASTYYKRSMNCVQSKCKYLSKVGVYCDYKKHCDLSVGLYGAKCVDKKCVKTPAPAPPPPTTRRRVKCKSVNVTGAWCEETCQCKDAYGVDGTKSAWCKWADIAGTKANRTCQKPYAIGQVGCQTWDSGTSIGGQPNRKDGVSHWQCNQTAGDALCFRSADPGFSDEGNGGAQWSGKRGYTQDGHYSNRVESYYANGKCVGMKKYGEACEIPEGHQASVYTRAPAYHAQCRPSGYCRDGICVPPIAAGSDCLNSFECGMNLYATAAQLPAACEKVGNKTSSFMGRQYDNSSGTPIYSHTVTSARQYTRTGIDAAFASVKGKCKSVCEAKINGKLLKVDQCKTGFFCGENPSTMLFEGILGVKYCQPVIPLGGRCVTTRHFRGQETIPEQVCANSKKTYPRANGSWTAKLETYKASGDPAGMLLCHTSAYPPGYGQPDTASSHRRRSTANKSCTAYKKDGEECTGQSLAMDDATYHSQCPIGYCKNTTGTPICTVPTECTYDYECGEWKLCPDANPPTKGSCLDRCIGFNCRADAVKDIAAGMWCDTGACRAVKPTGGKCTVDVGCPKDNYCKSQVCTASVAAGSACDRNRMCKGFVGSATCRTDGTKNAAGHPRECDAANRNAMKCNARVCSMFVASGARFATVPKRGLLAFAMMWSATIAHW